jgi:hypothetical protein
VFVNLANGAWIVLPNEVVIEQLDSFVLDGWKPDNAWMCDTETGDPLLSVQPGQAYDLYL